MSRNKFIVIVFVLIAAIIGLRSLSDWRPLAASTNPTARVNFLSAPPPWAKDAESVMTELETWRGQSFIRPLEIQIKPRADGEPAGWYSPETHQLIVTTDGSESFKRGVMLHEIFHALQDQTFDLLALHQSVTNADEDQALDALIEGEAMLAVSDLLNYNFADHAQLPEVGDISDELFNRLFEYGEGMAFVRSLRAPDNWSQVDQAFQSPPRSTREIYHPMLYPLSVASVDASPSQDKLGEYGFRLWLARDPKTRAQLQALSDVYLNDSLNVSATGEHTWVIQFKTDEAAQQVEALAPKAIAAMPDHPTSVDISRRSKTLTMAWRPQN